MKLSVCTITARDQPRYEWLFDALAMQARPDDEIEIVIVDLFDRSIDTLVPIDRRSTPSAIRRIQVSPPKPNPWQGEFRVTRRDLHGIANARNTALCLATHDYVAFVDDRVRLGHRWLETVRHHEATRTSAICGPCDRDVLGTGRQLDDRKERAPKGHSGCSGDWFYGGNFALPLEWALEINGCEEATDPVGRQDRVMGWMLENRGRRIDYLPHMAVWLDRKLRSEHPVPRVNIGRAPADKRTAICRRFGKHNRTLFTPDLKKLRAEIQRGEPFPVHSLTAETPDWYSGKRIGDM